MPRKPTRRTPTEQHALEQFADRLHHWRIERGFKSQSDLAREVWGSIPDSRGNGRLVAKNRDRISQYEMGRAWPTLDNLELLAIVLDITPEELAPDIVGATVERASISTVAGKTFFQAARFVTHDQATRIMVILNEG
jgi:transcriptional regulator with XRE-family HTH domain